MHYFIKAVGRTVRCVLHKKYKCKEIKNAFEEIIARKENEVLAAEQNLQLIVDNALVEQKLADPINCQVEEITDYPNCDKLFCETTDSLTKKIGILNKRIEDHVKKYERIKKLYDFVAVNLDKLQCSFSLTKDESLIMASYDCGIIKKELAKCSDLGRQFDIDIYVFDGSDDVIANCNKAQNFTYLCVYIFDGRSYIGIIDTNTKKRRKGIGSFALKTIEKVVSHINAELVICKPMMSPISEITGWLRPGGGITEDELKGYYIKNGFEVFGESIIKRT